MRPIPRRSFIKSLGVAGVAAAVPSHLQTLSALAQTPATPAVQPGSTRIFLNQIGYLPAGKKIATVLIGDQASTTAPPVESPTAFRVLLQDHATVVLKGKLSAPIMDAASGDLVAQADFSFLTTTGVYHLQIESKTGNALSDPFTIGSHVYADALRLTTRAFYGQRCGCNVDLGDGYKHPACHLSGAFDATSGHAADAVPNTGGWHDAGDYGRYVVNSGISTATLLWAWEIFPATLHSLKLDIPESGQGLPDFLAEIKWNLNWMLSLQDPADGGVWHKQTSLHFCGFVMPQDDALVSEIIGTGSAPYKSTCATADFAAVMAIAARCYAPFDKTFSAQCLAAARHAWTWSRSYPNVTYRNPPTVTTGDYGDPNCSDELLWASAELFRTTREAQYEAATLQAIAPRLPSLNLQAPSWSDVASMGLWTYAFATLKKPTPTTIAIQQATQSAAELLLGRMHINGYGNTLSVTDYRWGSNSDAGNQSLLLLIANRLQPHQASTQANLSANTDAALANLHYLLGRNCFGVSWVTQLGLRPFLHPHHRPSIADGIVAPWPGLLSGGPNSRGGDAVANALPQAPPMRMWIDNDRAYSVNEVAINWNAPLVFLLAAANSRLA